MSAHQFGRILLINCLLIITFNGLFAWQQFKAIATQPQLAISIGIAIYLIQLLTTHRLVGNLTGWLVQPFGGKKIRQAVGAMLVVELLATALLMTFTNYHPVSVQTNRWPTFLSVFILNTLPP